MVRYTVLQLIFILVSIKKKRRFHIVWRHQFNRRFRIPPGYFIRHLMSYFSFILIIWAIIRFLQTTTAIGNSVLFDSVPWLPKGLKISTNFYVNQVKNLNFAYTTIKEEAPRNFNFNMYLTNVPKTIIAHPFLFRFLSWWDWVSDEQIEFEQRNNSSYSICSTLICFVISFY